MRALSALCIVVALPASALAQIWSPIPAGTQTAAVCGGYTGPGDIVASWDVWGGLRAFKASACGTKAIQALKLINSATQDINSLSTNGQLDMASVSSFAGSSATCTGTISGTTLSVSSCSSGTLHVFDSISGTGITGPSYITSIGTCASPAGTCTLNASQTVASPETITGTSAVGVTKVYDQSGSLLCSSAACNLSVGALSAPLLVPNCLNGSTLPCIVFIARSTHLATPSRAWPNQPFTFSTVAERTANFTTKQALLGQLNNTTPNIQAGFSNATNTAYENGGAAITATASNSALHALQYVFNTTSSTINVDNTVSSPANAGSQNFGTDQLYWGQDLFGVFPFNDGYGAEYGIVASALSTGNQTSICHNQYSYWATAASC